MNFCEENFKLIYGSPPHIWKLLSTAVKYRSRTWQFCLIKRMVSLCSPHQSSICCTRSQYTTPQKCKGPSTLDGRMKTDWRKSWTLIIIKNVMHASNTTSRNENRRHSQFSVVMRRQHSGNDEHLSGLRISFILRSCQHDNDYVGYRRSVTGLSPHRRTEPGSQRPFFPGGHPFNY